jgi:hypothetical protein
MESARQTNNRILANVIVVFVLSAVAFMVYMELFRVQEEAVGYPGSRVYHFDPEQFADYEPKIYSDLGYKAFGVTDSVVQEINTVSFQLTAYHDGEFIENFLVFLRKTPGGMVDQRQEASNQPFDAEDTFEQRQKQLSVTCIRNHSKGAVWCVRLSGTEQVTLWTPQPFYDDPHIIALSRWDGEGEIVLFRSDQCDVIVYHNISINPELGDELFLPPGQ